MTSALQGKYIVNTRAIYQAHEFDKLIENYGAIPLSYPCIAIQPPIDTTLFDKALKRLSEDQIDWLVLTSANTVLMMVKRLNTLKITLPKVHSFRIATVGSSTAEYVQSHLNLSVDVMPETYVAESLAESILAQDGKTILLPESAIARPTLAQKLADGGAIVEVVEAYQTVCGEGGIDFYQHVANKQIDIVAFTSSSTVKCFMQRLKTENMDALAVTQNLCIACIGTKTAETAREFGFKQIIVPEEFTLIGMLNAMEQHFMAISGK